MKHTIYALVDPNTNRVRYVGRTCKTVAQRLCGHLSPGKERESWPVYQWIRSLRPQEPIIVVLQEVEQIKTACGRPGQYEDSVASAEVKWMKRFERSQLFNAINRVSRAYRKLVNTP